MPQLIFSSEELDDLRQRRKADPVGRQLFYDLMAAAEWCRKQPIPAEPEGGPDQTLKDGPVHPGETPYREDYLLAHEAFEVGTFAFERAVLQLSLVYALTGEHAWADRAIEWIDEVINRWPCWGPSAHQLDQFAVRIMNATVLGCDWLGEALSRPLRRLCRDRVSDYADRCLEIWGESLDQSQPGQLGNHYWFNTAMLGMSALWLGGEDARWREVADRCGRKLGELCDWAIGPDGDYLDKPHYLLYAFRWALPTLVAWQRAGGKT